MALGLRGQRDMDSGPVGVEDPDERARLKRQAGRILILSFGVAALVATGVTFLPEY